MPIPKPNTDEKEDDFMGRCMSDSTMMSEFPDRKQRAAVCLSKHKKMNEKSSDKKTPEKKEGE